MTTEQFPHLVDPAEVSKFYDREMGKQWHETVAPRVSRVLSGIYRKGFHRPEPVGTGVFVRVGELLFLVTAAHVIDDRPTMFGAPGTTKGLPPISMVSNVPPGGTRDDDKLDIGSWIINPEIAAKFTSGDALRLNDLDLYSPNAITGRADCFLNGFPASKQPRKRKSHGMDSVTFALFTDEVTDADYHAAGRNRRQHLLVGYAKDKISYDDGSKREGPDLQGMSGGAIWRMSGTDDVSRWEPILAAIAVRWRQEEPECVIGTRIAEWAKLAAIQFPKQFEREWSRMRAARPIEPGPAE